MKTFSDCLAPLKNREINEWTIEQLDIRPYQRILEIGYGAGNTLQETARKLKCGFLAGIDPSVGMHQQAYRKNKRFISGQLMQLHLGTMEELPYPSHYFDTIYGINAHFLRKDPQMEIMRLARLLKNGGRLVLAFQSPRGVTESDIRLASEQLEADCREAGLTPAGFEWHDRRPAGCIAVTGFKA